MKVGDIVNTMIGWKGKITKISHGCNKACYSTPIVTVQQNGSDIFVLVNEGDLKYDCDLGEYNQISW